MAAGWYVPAALGRVDLGDDADRTEHRRCRSGGYGARLPSGDTTLKECLAVGHRCGASAVSAHVGRGSALDRVPSLADRNIVGKGQHARREVRAVDAFHRCGSPGFVAGKNDFERALSREVLCSQKVREAGWGFDGRSLIPLELVLRRASSRVGHGPTFVDAIASEPAAELEPGNARSLPYLASSQEDVDSLTRDVATLGSTGALFGGAEQQPRADPAEHQIQELLGGQRDIIKHQRAVGNRREK